MPRLPEEVVVPATPEQIFLRYVAATMTRDADAVAAMFTADGIYEAPLARGGSFPQRVEGREAIRTFVTRLHQRMGDDFAANTEQSRFVVHSTTDPDTFVAEVDAALERHGEIEMMSLVYIFRMRDGQIALLRDYFAPGILG